MDRYRHAIILLLTLTMLLSFTALAFSSNGNGIDNVDNVIRSEDGGLEIYVKEGKVRSNPRSTASNNPIEVAGS